MIKLIASDMDGTLLDSKKRFPSGFFEAIEQLREKGVLFAVASGRQYASLRRDLDRIADHILFICENGALVMEKDKQLLVDPMDPRDVYRAVKAGRGLKGVYPVICRAQEALIESSADPAFIADTKRYYPSARIVDDLLAHCHYEDVCKVAYYDEGDAQTHELPVLEEKLADGLQVIISGEHWVDVMKMGVTKGKAMRGVQEKLELRPEECMAFGDYLNDYDLLCSVSESYAMENGHKQLKEIAKYIAPSCDEDGVMRVIRERFSL